MYQEWLEDPNSVSLDRLNALEGRAFALKLCNWPALAYMRSATEHYLRGDMAAYDFERDVARKKMLEIGAIELTPEEKLAKYEAGQYSFKVPPVSHASWQAKAWIKYIDLHGVWH